MNICAQAIQDLDFTIADGARGFGIPVIIEDGTHTIGVSAPFFCQVGRKNFEVDTDTQVADSDWIAHISAKLADIASAGFVVEEHARWLITTTDIDGTIRNYQVRYKQLDHINGVVTLLCADVNRTGNAANEALITAYLAAVVS